MCKYVDQKRSRHHAGHQEVSRCRTRGESEESIACRRQSTQARGSTLALKSRQMSSEVQNRGISGSIKRTHILGKLKKTTKKFLFKRRQSKNDLPDRAERNLNCQDILHIADCGWDRISLDSVPLCNRICASEDNEHIQMYKIDNKAFLLHENQISWGVYSVPIMELNRFIQNALSFEDGSNIIFVYRLQCI